MKTILVIDDDNAVRDAFELALDEEGCIVKSADSGVSGLQMIENEGVPDLIFLDLKMPGMDGVETLRQIRKIEPGVPVYIVTAFQKEFMQPLSQASDEGLDFQLASKPLSGDQIRQIVKAFLDN